MNDLPPMDQWTNEQRAIYRRSLTGQLDAFGKAWHSLLHEAAEALPRPVSRVLRWWFHDVVGI